MDNNKCLVSKYCGGCNYQGIDYKKQLQIKQDNINKLFESFCDVKGIIGSSNPYNYRNKVQVSYGYDEHHHVLCGNYVTSTHTIVPIEECMICDEKANEIIKSINRLVKKYHISIFDERVMKGCLRHVLIRTSNLNEYMIVLVTGSFIIKDKDLLIKDIIKFNPQVKTIIQNINNKRTSMILSEKSYTLYGKGYIYDELCGLRFQISASSFFQINRFQTEILYKEAIKAASLSRDDVLIDAYCGTGTISLIMADKVKKVLGVEINKHAIKDAVKNAKNNKVNNVEFICDDASDYMHKIAKQKYKIDILIMDPPRSGADSKFLKAVVSLMPKKITYVSCNPYTLKDNLIYLGKYYKINYVQPVDMFPYTEHVECVVSMQRKDNK